MCMNGKSRISYQGSNPGHSPVFQDDRKGLGYGQTSSTGFNSPRTTQSSYPYRDPDPYDDDEFDDILVDDELDTFVNKINGDIRPVDFMAGNSVDRAYFVGGNTRGLTGVMESGIAIAKNSISPIPGWSKKAQAASGGFTQQKAYDQRAYRRTGTKQGYSHRPPPEPGLPEEELVAFTIHDILDDDERILAKTRAMQDKIDKLNKKGTDV